MTHSLRTLAITLAASALLLGCNKSSSNDGGGNPDAGSTTAAEGQEWVNFHAEVPLQASDFDALAGSLFGAQAQAGQLASNKELSKAFFATASADPSSPDQVRLAFSYDDGSGTPRPLADAPASFTIGKLFIRTVDAAMAQMASDVASNNATGENFNLAYQVTSTQGGTLSFAVHGLEGNYTLLLDVTSPHTSLANDHIGQAYSGDAPFDAVSGTVWFSMTQDEFDYFVDHAYGKGATAGQNFSDFALVPYSWLRLTVTPQLDQNIVNVGFELLNPDGSRVPIAKAPASVMAGNTFQTLVDRQMANMAAQERAHAGSSTPWQVPFYYDQPEGGGVVQVIAQGSAGQYQVAYSVTSPRHTITDVPFVAYKPITFPPPDPNATKPCYQRGDPNLVQALEGVFQISFTASDVIKENLDGGALQGDIGCSIYRLSDVTVTGPLPDAGSLEDFKVLHADLLAATAPTFTTANTLPDGDYQILCAQYVDGNDAAADQGDPVTLPIGGFEVACNLNPVTVEFAILNPSNH